MEWKRMMFKGLKVYILFDDSGHMAIENNRVAMKYQIHHEQEYKVNPSNVVEIDQDKLKLKGSKKSSQKKPERSDHSFNEEEEEEVVSIYTDGACHGNPGPAGIGVYLKYGKRKKEISRFLGQSTNNIAELVAIQVALKEIKQPNLPVRLYTDSEYCHGILAKGWKPTRNQQLISNIKEEMKRFRDLRIIKVRGHVGLKENERVDKLAKRAINEKGGG